MKSSATVRWMESLDGEVLIIGMMVGWSGGVPKGLVSVRGFGLRKWFFFAFFRRPFFSDFFRCWVDFGRFWEAKTEAKIDFWDVCFQCFFRVSFGIHFGWIFEASEPEKSIKTSVFSMVFANFHKIDIFEKVTKKL